MQEIKYKLGEESQYVSYAEGMGLELMSAAAVKLLGGNTSYQHVGGDSKNFPTKETAIKRLPEKFMGEVAQGVPGYDKVITKTNDPGDDPRNTHLFTVTEGTKDYKFDMRPSKANRFTGEYAPYAGGGLTGVLTKWITLKDPPAKRYKEYSWDKNPQLTALDLNNPYKFSQNVWYKIETVWNYKIADTPSETGVTKIQNFFMDYYNWAETQMSDGFQVPFSTTNIATKIGVPFDFQTMLFENKDAKTIGVKTLQPKYDKIYNYYDPQYEPGAIDVIDGNITDEKALPSIYDFLYLEQQPEVRLFVKVPGFSLEETNLSAINQYLDNWAKIWGGYGSKPAQFSTNFISWFFPHYNSTKSAASGKPLSLDDVGWIDPALDTVDTDEVFSEKLKLSPKIKILMAMEEITQKLDEVKTKDKNPAWINDLKTGIYFSEKSLDTFNEALDKDFIFPFLVKLNVPIETKGPIAKLLSQQGLLDSVNEYAASLTVPSDRSIGTYSDFYGAVLNGVDGTNFNSLAGLKLPSFKILFKDPPPQKLTANPNSGATPITIDMLPTTKIIALADLMGGESTGLNLSQEVLQEALKEEKTGGWTPPQYGDMPDPPEWYEKIGFKVLYVTPKYKFFDIDGDGYIDIAMTRGEGGKVTLESKSYILPGPTKAPEADITEKHAGLLIAAAGSSGLGGGNDYYYNSKWKNISKSDAIDEELSSQPWKNSPDGVDWVFRYNSHARQTADKSGTAQQLVLLTPNFASIFTALFALPLDSYTPKRFEAFDKWFDLSLKYGDISPHLTQVLEQILPPGAFNLWTGDPKAEETKLFNKWKYKKLGEFIKEFKFYLHHVGDPDFKKIDTYDSFLDSDDEEGTAALIAAADLSTTVFFQEMAFTFLDDGEASYPPYYGSGIRISAAADDPAIIAEEGPIVTKDYVWTVEERDLIKFAPPPPSLADVVSGLLEIPPALPFLPFYYPKKRYAADIYIDNLGLLESIPKEVFVYKAAEEKEITNNSGIKALINKLQTMSFKKKLQKLLLGSDLLRTPVDIHNGKLAHQETLMYEIAKYKIDALGNENYIQSIFLPITEKPQLSYYDTQIIPYKNYFYKIFAHKAILGTEYKLKPDYKDPTGDFSKPTVKVEPKGQGATGAYFVEMPYEVEPFIEVVRVPYYNTEAVNIKVDKLNYSRVEDSPPLAPQVNIVPLRNINNKILILMNNSIGQVEQYPRVIFEEDKDLFIDVALSQDRKPSFAKALGWRTGSKLLFKSDDSQGLFQVFRIDTAPTSYLDFADDPTLRLEQLDSTGLNKDDSMFDNILPNKTYYYSFRFEDIHGNISNPTDIYKVRMIQETGAIPYLTIEVVDIRELQKKQHNEKFSSVKKMQKYLFIQPNALQTILNKANIAHADNSNYLSTVVDLGTPDVPGVFGQKFKLRVTSAQTGRKIDINLTVKGPGNIINE